MPAQLTERLSYPPCWYATNGDLVKCILRGRELIDRMNADRDGVRKIYETGKNKAP